MRFLIIGLGSMGKRRVRCLQALGHRDITGLDPRKDRRVQAASLYAIKTIDRLGKIAVEGYDAMIISVPPDLHHRYLSMSVDGGVPAFVEASLILNGLPELDRMARRKGVLLCPSCTLRFHPAIREIKSIVHGGRFGTFTDFSYHSGQYLPDWHPWEKVRDFYVSKRETGGCREIVPFELTWLTDIFGLPAKVAGFRGRTMDVGADIDDCYAMALRFKQGFGILMVDVVARSAVRSLIVNLERGQIRWRWDVPQVDVYDVRTKKWTTSVIRLGKAAKGYNKSIAEGMYVDEMRAFIRAVQGKGEFPNTMRDDIKVLKVLYSMEGRQA